MTLARAVLALTCAAVAVAVASPLLIPAVTGADAERLRSGFVFLSEALQAEQRDPDRNRGMLWVLEGERLWGQAPAADVKSCADCHGDAASSMDGAATRYPAVDPKTGDLLNLELRINRCRTSQQNADAFAYESQELLALTAYVAHQSRGQPVQVSVDGAAAKHVDAGRTLWMQRQGQLNLACAQCHRDNVGQKLRADTISSGLGTGYPAYRLTWQGLGSLHRRLKACQQGVRATVFAPGSPEHLALELFLAVRAEGQPIETPGLRR